MRPNVSFPWLNYRKAWVPIIALRKRSSSAGVRAHVNVPTKKVWEMHKLCGRYAYGSRLYYLFL